jgi:hypothetical protein
MVTMRPLRFVLPQDVNPYALYVARMPNGDYVQARIVETHRLWERHVDALLPNVFTLVAPHRTDRRVVGYLALADRTTCPREGTATTTPARSAPGCRPDAGCRGGPRACCCPRTRRKHRRPLAAYVRQHLNLTCPAIAVADRVLPLPALPAAAADDR